jgi:hypothetical protein
MLVEDEMVDLVCSMDLDPALNICLVIVVRLYTLKLKPWSLNNARKYVLSTIRIDWFVPTKKSITEESNDSWVRIRSSCLPELAKAVLRVGWSLSNFGRFDKDDFLL